jgi:hypothetical protein
MPTPSQIRPPQSTKIQQCSNIPVAAMTAQQFVPDPYTTDFAVSADRDRFQGDTENGDVGASVTIANLTEGKPYIIDKIHADNTLTITFEDGTFDGSPTVVLGPGAEASFAFVRKGTTVLLAFPSGTPGEAPDGALAADQNLADLDDANAARENLGVNKVYLTAKLSLVGATLDEIRLLSPVDGNVTAIYSIQSKGPIATGAATTTLTVGGAAPTANTITHAIAEAAGQKKTMLPTGPNTAVVALTTEIRLACTGTNDAAGSMAGYLVEITRPAVAP